MNRTEIVALVSIFAAAFGVLGVVFGLVMAPIAVGLGAVSAATAGVLFVASAVSAVFGGAGLFITRNAV